MAMTPDPHLPTTDPGLLTLYWATETVDTDGRPMSGIQVQSGTGTWQNVSLKPDEVLVMLGTSMQQATAGSVSPTVYRMIGIPSPLPSSPVSTAATRAAVPTSHPAVTVVHGKDYEIKSYRAVVKFELRPMSSAVFDFSKALQQVGHAIPRKYSSGDLKCVKDMMDDFNNMALRRAVTVVPVADDCDEEEERKPNGGIGGLKSVSKRRANVDVDHLQMEEKEKNSSSSGNDVGKGTPSSNRRRSGRLSNRQPIDYNFNRQNKRRKPTHGNDNDYDPVVVMEGKEEAAAAVGEEAAMQLTNRKKGIQKQPLPTNNNNNNTNIEQQHPLGVQRRLSGALVAQQQKQQKQKQQHGDARYRLINPLAKDAKQEQPAAGKVTRQAPTSPAGNNNKKNNNNNGKNTKLICFAHDKNPPEWISLKIGPKSVYVYKDALVPIDPNSTSSIANGRRAYQIRPDLWDSTTHQFKLTTITIASRPNSEAAFLAPTNTIQAGVLFEKYCSEIVGAPIGCLEFRAMEHGGNGNGGPTRVYGGDVLRCRTIKASVADCWKGKGMGILTGLLGVDGPVLDSFYERLDL